MFYLSGDKKNFYNIVRRIGASEKKKTETGQKMFNKRPRVLRNIDIIDI